MVGQFLGVGHRPWLTEGVKDHFSTCPSTSPELYMSGTLSGNSFF